MISKTTPFTTVRLSPSGDQLTLPAGFRFEDSQEVFVWREPMSGHVILSTDPPSMSVTEGIHERVRRQGFQASEGTVNPV